MFSFLHFLQGLILLQTGYLVLSLAHLHISVYGRYVWATLKQFYLPRKAGYLLPPVEHSVLISLTWPMLLPLNMLYRLILMVSLIFELSFWHNLIPIISHIFEVFFESTQCDMACRASGC